MCGFAGFFGGHSVREGAAVLRRMASSIRHRGPDQSDIWEDRESGIGFAAVRLAIVDLSAAGHQPMRSSSGRFVISYNGEIYNHQELRQALEESGKAPSWRGHSDTETLLAAIEAWGLEQALKRATGMFAFALWDQSDRTLALARDRFGEKPLYYGREWPGGPFLFGSELKALRQHPDFRGEIDRDALTLLLRYNYIPAPFSVYRGIAKLPPGTFLTLRSDAEPIIQPYWSAADMTVAGVSDPLRLEPEAAVDRLEDLLEAAIGRQMIADVPLGAFLSGGIDSSTVVALMQKLSARPVKTFTIGFHEKDYNEAEHAKAVAAHLGTDHTELYVSPEEARSVIPKLPTIYDEPFADSSQIPTYLVSALARRHVTVSLSGDGGDELFGGYTRYALAAGLWSRISRVPGPLRNAAARSLVRVPASVWTRAGEAAGGLLPRMFQLSRFGEKVHKGAPLLRSRSAERIVWRADFAVARPRGGGDRRPRAGDPGHRSRTRPSRARNHRTHDGARHDRLPSGRHIGQGRSGGDGRLARKPRALP